MSVIAEIQYIGCIEWYKTLLKSKYVHFESCEFYQKMSFRNRTVIAGANGLLHLSVPLEKGRTQKTPIKEVRICHKDKWQMNHWRAITSAYNRSPFFEFYAQELSSFYVKRSTFLFDWNMQLFDWVKDKLEADIEVTFSQEYIETYPTESSILDARNKWLPKNYQSVEGSPRYRQVFEDRLGFQPNLSIIDLLFCEGPNARNILLSTV